MLTDSGTVRRMLPVRRADGDAARHDRASETLECGSNVLAGVAEDDVLRAMSAALARPGGWQPPPEYLVPHVSATVASLVVGFDRGRTGAPGQT